MEVEGHKSNHKYHVITKLDFPLFEEKWSAKEILLLFEGIEKCGFGNWTDISGHIATDKTRQDCSDFYQDYFLLQKNHVPENINVLTKIKPGTNDLTTNLSKKTDFITCKQKREMIDIEKL